MTECILLVEDEELNRALVRAILARAAAPLGTARLVEAGTLAAARTALATEPVDVILLDVNLPDGNGLTLAAELAAAGGHRPAVIALTAGVLPHQRAAALEAGCDAFLDKPYGSTDLLALLTRYLERSPF
jgi:CheY-like chemotaxis protein